MTDHSTAAPASPQGYGARWGWLLPAGTFVAGVALGGTLVGVGALGGDDGPPPPSSTAADAGAEEERDGRSAAPDTDDPGLYVRVPDSCVQTADDATTLVEHVDRVVAAVADLEPERLRQTVDEVQRIREEVAGVAEQCQQEAALRLQDAASAEPAPTS